MWVWLKLTPKVDFCLVRAFFVNFFTHSTKRYLDGHQTLLVRPKSAIYTPKRDDEHPCHFYMKVPPLPHTGNRCTLYQFHLRCWRVTGHRFMPSTVFSQSVLVIAWPGCLTGFLCCTEVCYSCILGRTYFVERSIHLIEEHWLLIITGVQASEVIIDRLLRQCCFVWSEIVGPHSSGNFNDWPLKSKAGSKYSDSI